MYKPEPIDTSDVILPKNLLELTEKIAENVHENWARQRWLEGWRYGEHRDDLKKLTPCMIPYSDLPEAEKIYDRQTALETLKVIIKLGGKIEFRPD